MGTAISLMPIPSAEIPPKSPLKKMSDVSGATDTYEVYGLGDKGESPLIENDHFKMYVAKLPSGQLGLMMIALSPDQNFWVDKQARIGTTIQRIATDIDMEALAAGTVPPHYGAFFPTIVERMDADGRIALIMGYHSTIKSYKALVPLVVATNGQRIDLQTGAWVLGKTLKALGFMHSLGFSANLLDESNVLLETTQHGVMILNLSEVHEDSSSADQQFDVMQASANVHHAVGGTKPGDAPFDEALMSKEHHKKFLAFLAELMASPSMSADAAFTRAYEMFDEIWPKQTKTDDGGTVVKRNFHEWTVYPFEWPPVVFSTAPASAPAEPSTPTSDTDIDDDYYPPSQRELYEDSAADEIRRVLSPETIKALGLKKVLRRIDDLGEEGEDVDTGAKDERWSRGTWDSPESPDRSS